MTSLEKIKAIQRAVSVDDDGVIGPVTINAIYDRVCGATPVQPVPATGAVDERSEKNIATLHPRVQEAFRDFCRKANTAIAPKRWKWICGTRTYAEQAELHRKYLNGGPQATSAGNSAHNFGIAMDGGVFDGSSYEGECEEYKIVGRLGRSLGFNWGADFGDEPHFSKRPAWATHMGEREMMRELRRRHDAGIDVFA